MSEGDSEMQAGERDERDDGALVEAFAEFAHDERRRSPLYAALSDVVRADREIRSLFDTTEQSQRRPVLLFAALHEVARAHADHPFSRALPTVSGTLDVAAAAAGLPAFCRVHRARLRTLLATRRTQTNEVGRSAPLLVGLANAVSDVGRRLALVELGASAGLLLAADRYRVEIGDRPPIGEPASPVSVQCRVRGEPPPLSLVPPIGDRIGVDLDPVDIADAADASWLLSCVWADDLDRFRRLDAAIELVRRDPPIVRSGDAADALPELLAAIDPDAHPTVFNCWALTYMSTDRRQAIVRTLADEARRRDLTWLSMESPTETPDLPRPAASMREPRATDVVAWCARGGTVTVRRLAEMHPHGRWIDWHH